MYIKASLVTFLFSFLSFLEHYVPPNFRRSNKAELLVMLNNTDRREGQKGNVHNRYLLGTES